jgi:hypothetical protein
MDPRTAASTAGYLTEPAGTDERFAGFGVLGLPFSSGHLLALRHFPVSTVGPAYKAVWLRDPDGSWTMAADAAPEQSCARYFGEAVDHKIETDVMIDWVDASTLRVDVGEPVDLAWTITLRPTPITTVMSAACSALPDGVWRRHGFSRAMGAVAAVGLGTGRMRLTGRTPNHQSFVARPRRIWMITDSSAQLRERGLGRPAPLAEQASLGDFWLPQRGLFMVGWSAFSADA